MYFLVKKMCSTQGLREGDTNGTLYLGPGKVKIRMSFSVMKPKIISAIQLPV